MSDPSYNPLSASQHWFYCPRQCALIHKQAPNDLEPISLQNPFQHQLDRSTQHSYCAAQKGKE